MNLPISESKGILVVSQFTLFGNLRKGTRPSFNCAARGDFALQMYLSLYDKLRSSFAGTLAKGEFGEEMKITASDDGPVSIWLDSKTRLINEFRNLFPDEFFHQSAIDVAPKLLGASLCFKNNDGLIKKLIICETEAYHGTDDLASHASRGKKPENPTDVWSIKCLVLISLLWRALMLNLVTDREGTLVQCFSEQPLKWMVPTPN